MKSSVRATSSFWPYVAIFGIIIYIAIDVLLAHLRPDYSLLHNAESDYGRGPYAWVMDLNFLLRCGFSLALVKSIWSTFPNNSSIKKGSYWLIAWAVTSGLLAFFADNPYGYPDLKSGAVHLLFAFIAFVSAMVAMVLLSHMFKKEPSWGDLSPVLLVIAILSIVAALFLFRAGFGPHRLGGLYERVFLGLVLLWELIVSIKIARLTAPKAATRRASHEIG